MYAIQSTDVPKLRYYSPSDIAKMPALETEPDEPIETEVDQTDETSPQEPEWTAADRLLFRMRRLAVIEGDRSYTGEERLRARAGHALAVAEATGVPARPIRTDDLIGALLNTTTITLASVQPTGIDWLWPGRIPLGMVTLFDGDPGLGKSTVLLDLAARGSVGGSTATGEQLEAFTSLILTSEDDPAITLRPRLDLAGGDPRRVHVRPSLSLPEQADQLDAEIERLGARFVYLDPIVEYLSETVKTISDHAVRRALKPLVEIARRRQCAIVAVRHLNKQGGLAAIYRGGGSIGFGGLARSVLAVGRDPDDEERFVLAAVKINVARRPASLAYRLVASGPYEPARVEWLGESQHSAETLIGKDQDQAGEKSKAEKLGEAMREVITANGGRMVASDMYVALEADGWDLTSEDLKHRARRRGRIKSEQPRPGLPWEVTLL